MAAIDAFKVRAVIEAGYDKNSLRRANQEIARSFNGMTSRMSRVAAAARSSQTLFMTTGAAITAAFGAGALAAASFEEQFVRVKKTLDIKGEASQVEKALDNIGKKLINLTKQSPVTTDAITEIASVGGQLGIAAKDIVSFTDTVQKLTIATNLSAENAALGMSRLQEITGSSVDELDNLGATLVDLGNNFAATESEIMTAATQIATSTAQIQGEMNNAAVDALAFSTALKAIGQPSQAGATAIVRLMSELSEAMAVGGSNLELFAKVARMSVPAFEELYSLDSSQAVATFIKGLDDTSSVGLTNISVLQKLGLGQVRTQKAILALAKANDTLFDSLNTANTAFRENTALTEEAERRYETLFSEFQKGKNILKAEFIDFGLDKLDGAKEIVRDLNNALVTITKGSLLFVDNFARIGRVALPVVAVFQAIRASVKQAATDLQLFAQTTERANAAALALSTKYNSKGNARFTSANAYQYEMTEGGQMTPQLAGAMEPRGLLAGRMGLPMGGIRARGFKEMFGRSFSNRIMNTVSQPQLLEMIYGGNVPNILKMSGELEAKALRNKRTGKLLKNPQGATAQKNLAQASYTQDYFERFSEEGLGGFVGRTFMPTNMGKAYLKTLTLGTQGFEKLFKIVTKTTGGMLNFGTQSAISLRMLENRIKSFQGMFGRLRERISNALKSIRTGFSQIAEGFRFGLENDKLFQRFNNRIKNTAKVTKSAGEVIKSTGEVMRKALNLATGPIRLFQTGRAASQIRDRMLGIPDLKMSIKQMYQAGRAATEIRNSMLGIESRTVKARKAMGTLSTFVKTELNIGFSKLRKISPFKFMTKDVDGLTRRLLLATKAQLALNNAAASLGAVLAKPIQKLTKARNFLFGTPQQTTMGKKPKMVNGELQPESDTTEIITQPATPGLFTKGIQGIKSLASKAGQGTINRLDRVNLGLTKSNNKALQIQAAIRDKINKRQAMYSELSLYKQALYNKGALTTNQILDKEIQKLLKRKGLISEAGDMTKAATRRYRRAAIGGRFGAFESEINELRDMQSAGKELSMEQLQLLEATDKARMGFGRFRTALLGVAKAFGKLAIQLAVFQAVFQIFAKLGEASNGLNSYNQQLATTAEKLTEIYKQQLQINQLTGQDGVLSEIQDEATLEAALKRIDDMKNALAKSRADAAKELGTSFVQDILIAGAGKEGSAIDYLIGAESAFFDISEDKVKGQIGESIGNVLLSAIDPENIKARGGKLPTVGEVVESIFFSEETVGGIKVPSSLFDGVSSGMLMALQDSGQAISGQDLIKLAGLDDFKDPGLLKELILDLQNYSSKRGIGDERFLRRIMEGGGQLGKIITNFKKEFGDEFDDLEIAQFAFDVAQGIATAEGVIGTSLGNIEDNFMNTLSPNSQMGKQVKAFLKERLEEFKDTGLVSAEQVARAGNNYQKIVNLYSSTYDKFTQQSKLTSDQLKENIGVSENTALQLAARLEQAFTEARKSLVALTAPLPEDAFEDMSALEVLLNTIKKDAAQTKFEKATTLLGDLGKPVLAAELGKMGVGALGMAETYLENPAIAAAQEMYMRSLGGADYVGEIVQDETFEAEKQRQEEMGFFVGQSAAEGIAKGFEENQEMLTTTFEESLKAAMMNIIKSYMIFSPSGWTRKFIGKPLIDGVIEGVKDGELTFTKVFGDVIDKSMYQAQNKDYELPDITASFKGTNVSYEGLVGILAKNSEYATNTVLADGVLRSLASIKTGLADFAQMLQNTYSKANTRLQEAFELITSVTSAERAQTSQARNLIKAKQDYAATLRREATLTERIEKARENLKELEISGMKGNITVQERIGVLQREIDLTERKRRLDKEFTARERIDIAAQERQVAELGRMFNLGIVSADDLEAARDTLSEMKGEFKSDTEKELFLLEYTQAIEAKEKYEKEILETSPELISARETYIGLLDEQALISLDVQNGTNAIAEAEERVAKGVLDVDAAYANYRKNAPEYEKEIEVLGTAFDGVNTRVNTLIETITKLSDDGTFDFSNLTTQITGITREFSEYLFAKEMDELMTAGGVNDFTTKYMVGLQEAYRGTDFEGQTFGELFKGGKAGFAAMPIIQELYKSLGGFGGKEIKDFSNIAKFRQYFESDPTKRFQRSNDVLDTTGYAGAVRDFVSMLGIGTTETDEGELAFSIANAEEISEGLSKELMAVGLRGLSDAAYTQLLSNNLLNERNMRSGSIRDDKAEQDAIDDAKASRFGTPGANTVINLNSGNSGGGFNFSMDWLNNALANASGSLTGFGYVPGGMMGLRTKGFKMGGRVPDMTNIKPKKYAMGGRDHMMRRALVGEYGPEEVRFVPGSGFLVKPLTHGGRGNNTVVEHLSVNVTGVPSDPSQARKAAIEIRKALSRLDREGGVGGSIRRT
jgi:TP901 family phage tail tape measure protein